MSDDWFKELLMLPARMSVRATAVRENASHALRKQFGDPIRKTSCCGPRPDSYPEGIKVADIPELKYLLERTSTINMGYSPFYCCKVCGQEWYQDWVQQRFGGDIYVRKAI